MIAKLLTEHHLKFLNLKGGCRGSSESTLVKMPHCWKSHVVAQMYFSLPSKCSFHNFCTMDIDMFVFLYGENQHLS